MPQVGPSRNGRRSLVCRLLQSWETVVGNKYSGFRVDLTIPKFGGLYRAPSKRHPWTCAIYSATIALALSDPPPKRRLRKRQHIDRLSWHCALTQWSSIKCGMCSDTSSSRKARRCFGMCSDILCGSSDMRRAVKSDLCFDISSGMYF